MMISNPEIWKSLGEAVGGILLAVVGSKILTNRELGKRKSEVAAGLFTDSQALIDQYIKEIARLRSLVDSLDAALDLCRRKNRSLEDELWKKH